jgi:phosphoglycolate phosphatase
VIFDLDGTLVDSLGDIAAAMNHALAGRGFPAHPVDAYRSFIGEGVRRLAERAMPPGTEEARPAVLAAYEAEYVRQLPGTSRLYPGIPALLQALSEADYPMAVLSNKPDAPTRRIADALLSAWSFRAVAGERPGTPRKPDPAGALVLARALERPPAEVVFVGDTLIDVTTARAAGMRPLGVLWGFRAEEVAASGVPTVRRPEEVLAFVGRVP